MIRNSKLLFLSVFLGGLIGCFPLLTGQVSVSPTKVAEAAAAAQKTVVVIDVQARSVQFNGTVVGEEVLTVNGTTYIPVRMLETLGGDVRWDEQTRKITVEMR